MTTHHPAPPGASGSAATATAAGNLFHWRTVDLVTAATIGVAIGVVFRLWGAFYGVIEAAWKGFPPLAGLTGGVWFLAAAIAALVVRRPGAAILAEMVGATVEMLLAGQWGAGTLVSGALQGLGVELGFALFLYRRFGVPQAALGAVLAAFLECVAYEFHAYWSDWTPAWQWTYFALFALSGVVISGLLAWLLVRALARTGVLDAFPPGVEHHASRAG
ncbi:MAG TPA: ECF transporter S component [Dermatophilaceae bacterium]|nr:ECF transporter S component [Dermatophilaceae bacterium]